MPRGGVDVSLYTNAPCSHVWLVLSTAPLGVAEGSIEPAEGSLSDAEGSGISAARPYPLDPLL